MQIILRSNLDCFLENKWPSLLTLPRIGECVASNTIWPSGFQLVLKVCDITYYQDKVEVELNIKNGYTIQEFYRIYNAGKKGWD